ncbi:MAG: 16S rRNA (cytosine(967)-C(5))-methyltransferase RsmB, partial [Verrucomicrobia bacterium]|nr:16S rRNA (cytosine(967)-C(5))-methyltransferase RsmB [Verrucomicrobiota bacterium]
YAAVHETVEAAKAALGARQADFVNAILRRTLREKDVLLAELERQPLGIRQSHPDELLERWIRHFGLSPAETLCTWNNQRADVIIRVNQLKTTPEAYLKTLSALGLGDQVQPHSFTLAHGVRVTELPGYGEGHFMVMDPVAVQAVDLLDPQPGDHILDACAAPGGKTALIAARLRLKGQLVAMDLRTDRLPRLRANLERLGCAAFVKVVQGDARRLRPESFGRFDRILLDVPCSNTGVIRRKPDVRWRFSKARLTRLGATQRELLERMAGLVKRGGCIVYSTCSLEPEENDLLISAWLKTHPEFRLQSSRQSFPPTSGQDGAYAVLLAAK